MCMNQYDVTVNVAGRIIEESSLLMPKIRLVLITYAGKTQVYLYQIMSNV